MDPCDYCKGREAVMWNWIDGDICMTCLEKKWAKERQEEIDRKNALRDFFHE